MRTDKHLLIGAAVGGLSATLPDFLLLFFGWRKTWLPEDHPIVRAHRFIHSPEGLILIGVLGWASHLIIDWHSEHRSNPNEYE